MDDRQKDLEKLKQALNVMNEVFEGDSLTNTSYAGLQDACYALEATIDRNDN